MSLSPKLRKRLFWIFLFPVICLLAVGGILHFLIVHRFKDGIRYIINKESKGRYAFDASDAKLSLWDRSIQLKGAKLRSTDTVNADHEFSVQIPEIYFSLGSWKELLFHKKIIVDSLSIIEPQIAIRVHKLPGRKEHAAFRATNILDYLEKALTHLNVHSFSLKDAAFSYWQLNAPAPLRGDHINLSVSNFMVINDEDSHLLGSEKVSMLLGKQHWGLPDGRSEVTFNQLTFNSKGQRFELDSFSFYQKAATGNGAVSIQADKFFFNSQHLSATYQKEQLLLDSLIFIHPVLSIPAYSGEKSSPDSADDIPLTKKGQFGLINVKYIGVIDGELLLQNKDGQTIKAATRKANMSIFNLVADSAKDPVVSTDSIRINLRNVEFLTRDSLYKLTIDQFTFRRNDAIFSHVRFGPVSPVPSGKKVEFTAPSLLLRNISFVELMRQRLKASAVELRQPLIVLSDRSKEVASGGADASVRPAASAKKLALFYQSLHHVSELINTPDFTILHGGARYQRTGSAPLQANAKNLNAHILLNKFFVSDSLVNIKEAIANLSIDDIDLVSPNAKISMNNFWVNGVKKNNRVRQLTLSTKGGLELMGENVFWHVFDWDIYQQSKDIQIDSLSAGRLTLRLKPVPAGSQHLPGANSAPAALPVIRIGTLQTDEILFDGNFPGNSLHFNLNGLYAQNVTTANRSFTWASLKTNLHDITLEDQKVRTTIREVNFDSDKELLAKDIQFRSTGFQFFAPELRLSAAIHSTDINQLLITSLLADKANVHFIHTKGKDTLEGSAIASLRIENLVPNKGRIQYEKAAIQLAAVTFKKSHLSLNVPSVSIRLSDGRVESKDNGQVERNGDRRVDSNGAPTLASAIHLVWQDASLRYNKDSMTIAVNDLSGSFREDSLSWSPGVKLGWQWLVAGTTVNKGCIHYKGRKITAAVTGCSWEPEGRSLQLRGFSVIPNESRDTLFSKAKWQGDYIDIKGNSVTFAGIQLPRQSRLPSIRVNKIILDGITLNASRDKRIPFRHGLEKLMPTQLINTISFPANIDSTFIRASNVTYNECSIATGRWSSIPIQNINGVIVNLGNIDNQEDTLKLTIAGQLFDGHIRHFMYHELYGDSLSAFAAGTWLSAIDLTRFSQVSIPAAAVSITGGHADTSWSQWQGNKYATFGTMNFHYDRLKIKVLNKNDSSKRGLLPTLETWAANLILPDKRKRTSAIFVERDREKFVFNYWVKAQTSGLLSTVGLKSSKAYRRQYEKKWASPGRKPAPAGPPASGRNTAPATDPVPAASLRP